MSLVALVIAHNLVFLLAYGVGFDQALARSGHDASWGMAAAIVLAAGTALFALAVWRLYRLGLVVRDIDPGGGRYVSDPVGFGGRLVGLWWRVGLATTLLFVIQENVEHLRIGDALPGLSVLGSARYGDAALVILGVTLAVALVGALFLWRRDLLVARIADALRRRRPRPQRAVRLPDLTRDRRPESLVGHGLGVRAPPLPAR